MNQATKSSSGIAEESAAAARQLNAMALSMKHAVSELLNLIGDGT
jgi:methyl-accepting chemotaxis protein